MKKRILALALAGTTAFSVFGSAISANATLSTDTVYEVDAYVSYSPVATKIDVNDKEFVSVADSYLYNNGEGTTWSTHKDKAALSTVLKNDKRIQTNYTVADRIFVYDTTTFYVTKDCQYFILNNNGTYSQTTLNDVNLDGYLGIKKLSTGEYTVPGVYKTGSITDLQPFGTKAEAIAAMKEAYKDEDAVKAKPETLYVFTPDFNDRTFDIVYDSETDFKGAAKYADEDAIMADTNCVKAVPNADTSTDVDDSIEVSYRYLNNNDTWTDVENGIDENEWKAWSFNSDMTGEATVYPFTVTSKFVTIDDVTYLKSEKTEVPTIYAYDFIPETIPDSSVSNVANNWNADNLAGTTNAIGDASMVVETGRGSQYSGSIRYDVVTDWEDFLEELALNDDFGYSESFSEFRDNYLDMFYSDPVFDRWTGELVGYKDVDLYNIEGLLWDIWQLHERADYEAANTSELIYLMQQYDKYIGEYINQAEVASDDWGDLLLSVLDAATEDDFRNATEYRKYQNEVEDLRDAYELATTANMIREAEVKMYQLLVSANTRFRASANPDKAALNSSLEGLFFNVGDVPTEYSVLPSTTGTTNVDYTNYNYYVSALNITSAVSGQNLEFTGTLTRGYYSLYPMDDYYEAGNKNYVYPGNVAATTGENVVKGDNYYVNGTSTDEYEWFWNVYQLAANMNASNTKQGSVDAVNDALNAAVAELTATITPNSTEVAAVEDALDKYAGKIDTDYDKDYYAKYTQANDYAEVAEGKWQTRIAAMINGVAGEALTYQGTQVTVTKNDMKTVETAIKNGKTALEAIKESDDYNAAQVTALNKAIDQAQYLVDLYEGTYSSSKTYQSVNKVYTRLVGDKDQMVKSDLTNAIEAIDAAINYSEIVMGWSKNDAGKWQYGTEEGYLNDGWHQVDGGKTWFYFNADGTAKQSEWWNDNGTWYWFNSNCGAACGWAKVDGSWYYFKGNNAMKTGWEKVDGNWYYMASSGKMVTGWCEVNGKWYYFSKASNSLGQMLYSTTVDGYKLGADGAWIK